jgi:hypothetical protein
MALDWPVGRISELAVFQYGCHSCRRPMQRCSQTRARYAGPVDMSDKLEQGIWLVQSRAHLGMLAVPGCALPVVGGVRTGDPGW